MNSNPHDHNTRIKATDNSFLSSPKLFPWVPYEASYDSFWGKYFLLFARTRLKPSPLSALQFAKRFLSFFDRVKAPENIFHLSYQPLPRTEYKAYHESFIALP